jgi:hypothetical protein
MPPSWWPRMPCRTRTTGTSCRCRRTCARTSWLLPARRRHRGRRPRGLRHLVVPDAAAHMSERSGLIPATRARSRRCRWRWRRACSAACWRSPSARRGWPCASPRWRRTTARAPGPSPIPDPTRGWGEPPATPRCGASRATSTST